MTAEPSAHAPTAQDRPAADLRTLVERAVAGCMRPSMQGEPHPDETAIVDAVMDAVGSHRHPANAAHHRRLRCAVQASHPLLSGIYSCAGVAAQTVLVPLALPDGTFAGNGLRVGVCTSHARELTGRYGAVCPTTPGPEGITAVMQDLVPGLARLAETLEQLRGALPLVDAVREEPQSDG